MTIYYKGMNNDKEDKKIMNKLYKCMVIILLSICTTTSILILFTKVNTPIIQKEIMYSNTEYEKYITNSMARQGLEYMSVERVRSGKYKFVKNYRNGEIRRHTYTWE